MVVEVVVWGYRFNRPTWKLTHHTTTLPTQQNYSYSTANKNSGIIWGEDTLFEYLLAPKNYIKVRSRGVIEEWAGLCCRVLKEIWVGCVR